MFADNFQKFMFQDLNFINARQLCTYMSKSTFCQCPINTLPSRKKQEINKMHQFIYKYLQMFKTYFSIRFFFQYEGILVEFRKSKVSLLDENEMESTCKVHCKRLKVSVLLFGVTC